MNTIIKAKLNLTVFGIFFTTHVFCQGFVNLNFESATIVPDSTSQYYPEAVYANLALPGWVVGGFIGPSDVLYNGASLGSPSVSILDRNGGPPALNGNYSVLLYGGYATEAASISQTAVVPANAESLLFNAQFGGQAGGILVVSLGGQNISFTTVASGSGYNEYGANLPVGMAGQTETLAFTALQGENFWNLDNIQFSPTPVPEPSTWALMACGVGLLGVFRRSRRSRALQSLRCVL